MAAGIILTATYVFVVLSPLLIVTILQSHSPNELPYEVARSFGLCAFAILCLQPLLTARIKWIERPFGLDILTRFHKYMGIFATLLLLSHPPLMVLGGAGLSLVTSLDQPYYIWFGRIGLVLLAVHSFMSVYSSQLGLTFEKWRIIHYILAPAIILAVFVHSWETGDDLKDIHFRMLWLILFVTFFAAYAYCKIVKPALLSRNLYEVTEVVRESHNVWTIKMAPPVGRTIFDYYPGQFHFVTFYRGNDLPVEEHHWTISSSPSNTNFLSSTIKESGDFTATIGRTKPGDKAAIEGPFGRFSHVLHPEDGDMVFIAGGIGITPFMSMLRHMADRKSGLRVLLLYLNKTEKDIVFRGELADLESDESMGLKVIHLLSNPGSQWQGEKGHLDRDKIQRCTGSMDGKAFYVCGPPAMSAKVVATLRDMGVPYNRIRTEIFSL